MMSETPSAPELVRPQLLADPATAGDELRRLGAPGATVALVPTMGALHTGHLSLVAAAHERADLVVVSIFVNPLQFAQGEDYDQYPRTLDADLDLLAAAGVDAVFAPQPAAMYPHGMNQVVIEPGPVGHVFEGRIRPTHFSGALTVVNKLLNVFRPDVALFGQKDAQQLFLVRAMAEQLNIPVRVVGMPIVRDPDGLARSSRNRYLSPGERDSALALSRAIRHAEACAGQDVRSVLGVVQATLSEESGLSLDYAAIVDEATFQPVDDAFSGEGRLILAARVGGTRLIDNALLHFPPTRGGSR